jgi:hypothetical protein
MRAGSEIMASVNPMFDRYSEALKVTGAGNATGMAGMIAAIYAVTTDHTHTILMLKPTTIIFAIGVLLFALGYLFLMYAYIYAEHYTSLIHPEAEQLTFSAQQSQKASIAYVKRTALLGLSSAFCFFVGFACALVALIRY